MMIMIDDSCENCISQFHKNLRPISSDSVIVPMLIIDYRRSTARNWHASGTIRGCRSVILPGKDNVDVLTIVKIFEFALFRRQSLN